MASNPLGSYSFVVCKSTGENVGEAVSAKERGLSMVLNGVHTAKLKLSLYDPLAPYLLPGVSRLKVFRNPSADELAINPGQSRSLVFHGTLPETGSREAAADEAIEAVFADPRFVLPQRYSLGTEAFTSGTDDQGDIAWSLLNTQNGRANGDTWMRQGGTSTGILRVRTYDQRPVADLLTELTQLIDGPDFDVDPIDGYALGLGMVQANFRAYARQGSDKPNAAFVYSKEAGESNVLDMQRTYLEVVNRATVTGNTQGDGTIPGLPITSTYDASNASFGIRESIASFPDVTTQATLDAKARGLVLAQSAPREVITIGQPTAECKSRPFEHYYLGDTIRASCRKGSMVFTNRTLRVYGINLDIDAQGFAAATLTTAT